MPKNKKKCVDSVRREVSSLNLHKGNTVPHYVVAAYAGTSVRSGIEEYSYADVERYKLALMAVSNIVYKGFGFLTKISLNRVLIQSDAEAVDYEYRSFRLAEDKMSRRSKRYTKIDLEELTDEQKKTKEARAREMIVKLQYLKNSSKDYK